MNHWEYSWSKKQELIQIDTFNSGETGKKKAYHKAHYKDPPCVHLVQKSKALQHLEQSLLQIYTGKKISSQMLWRTSQEKKDPKCTESICSLVLRKLGRNKKGQGSIVTRSNWLKSLSFIRNKTSTQLRLNTIWLSSSCLFSNLNAILSYLEGLKHFLLLHFCLLILSWYFMMKFENL